MKTVHQVSDLTGVSVRTLHHYDSIGLLKPTTKTESGYRLYDDTALSKMQTILLFKELDFQLKDIKVILDNPNFDYNKAIQQQIKLLELCQKQLGELITHARNIIMKGTNDMNNFKAFDKSEIEQYAKEIKTKWGETLAYKEFQQKDSNRTDDEKAQSTNGLMNNFVEIGKLKSLSPDSQEVQKSINNLREYINKNFYTCSIEIFKSLGQMYIGDERMKKNINSAGGDGTAEFASKAIEIYCTNL